jgi:hypothetical protein
VNPMVLGRTNDVSSEVIMGEPPKQVEY